MQLGTLDFGNPKPRQFLLSLDVNSQSQVDRVLDDLAFTADRHDQSVHEQDRIISGWSSRIVKCSSFAYAIAMQIIQASGA